MDGRWVYHRTGQDMILHLEKELVDLIGVSPELEEQ
jgi:hypothetical protein